MLYFTLHNASVGCSSYDCIMGLKTFSDKGPPPLVWAGSPAARGKITIRGICIRLNYCVIFKLCIQIRNMAASRIITTWRAGDCRPADSIVFFKFSQLWLPNLPACGIPLLISTPPPPDSRTINRSFQCLLILVAFHSPLHAQKMFVLFTKVQTACGAHPASKPSGTAGFFLEG